jgi:hypothetical protein
VTEQLSERLTWPADEGGTAPDGRGDLSNDSPRIVLRSDRELRVIGQEDAPI